MGDSQKCPIHVTEFYLLEKAINSNWKWLHQTQYNVMNKRDFTEGIEVLSVLRQICLNPPKCHKIACNSAAIATLNVIIIMRLSTLGTRVKRHGKVKRLRIIAAIGWVTFICHSKRFL